MNKLRMGAAAAAAASLALGIATPLFAQAAKEAMPDAKMSGMNMGGMSASDMARMRAMMTRMEKMMDDCERMMKSKADAGSHASPPAPAVPHRKGGQSRGS